MALAHPGPDLETDGGVLCSAVPKCQPSTAGTSLGGYFPSLRKNVQGRRVGMEASRTLVLTAASLLNVAAPSNFSVWKNDG